MKMNINIWLNNRLDTDGRQIRHRLDRLDRLSGRQMEKLRQKIHEMFDDHKLGITVETNLKVVNYLDVTMSLEDGTYKPYRKDNNAVPVYIHRDSNHAPSVKRGLCQMISNRISDLSSSEEIFKSVAPLYNQALKNSGFTEEIKFSKDRQRRRTRKRKIIFFNPSTLQDMTQLKPQLEHSSSDWLKDIFLKALNSQSISTLRISRFPTQICQILIGSSKPIIRGS